MKHTKILSLITAVMLILSFSTIVYAKKAVYVPTWMQPYTVIVFDESLNYKVLQGGELTKTEKESREDIKAVGDDTSFEMLAFPDIKAEYDAHGFIQNIYYPVSGKPGEYQLDPTDTYKKYKIDMKKLLNPENGNNPVTGAPVFPLIALMEELVK